MIRRTFKFHDGQYAEPGFIPAWVANTDTLTPCDSRTVAHDSLEHMPSWVGFEGEMMSFGQMWFIRVDGHMVRSDDVLRGFYYDIEAFLQHVLDGTETLSEPPARALSILRKVQAGDYGRGPDWGQLQLQILRGVRHACEERASRGQSPHLLRRERLPAEDVDWIAAWMYLGYDLAIKRWKRLGLAAYQVADLFREVEREASRLPLYHCEDGDRITVAIDPGARRVAVRQWHSPTSIWRNQQ